MSDAWIQFARSGNPSHAGIPEWKPFAAETVPTMMFDDTVQLVNYPDRGEQQSIAEV
jgi:para-nitrobenzyl esterase